MASHIVLLASLSNRARATSIAMAMDMVTEAPCSGGAGPGVAYVTQKQIRSQLEELLLTEQIFLFCNVKYIRNPE